MLWPTLLLSCVIVATTSMIEAYSLRKNIWPASKTTIWFSPPIQFPRPEVAQQFNENQFQSDPELLERVNKRVLSALSRWEPTPKDDNIKTKSLISMIPGISFFSSIPRRTRENAQEKYRRPIGLPLRWG